MQRMILASWPFYTVICESRGGNQPTFSPGFWSGWLPRAIGDVLLVTLTSGITFAVNKYLVHDREMAKYTGHVAGFITSSIVYPFTVVSNTIVVVSCSGLAAGYPPHMPVYSGWTDCWRHLSRTNQLKRGSSLFFR